MPQRTFASVLALGLLLAGCASLQGPSGPPSEIVVDTPYSAREAFNRVGRELDSRGYSFEEIDRRFGALRTRPRRINDSVRVQIAVDVFRATPSELRLWGWYRTPQGTFRIRQVEQPGTAAYDAWQELEEVARWLPGQRIYQRTSRPAAVKQVMLRRA